MLLRIHGLLFEARSYGQNSMATHKYIVLTRRCRIVFFQRKFCLRNSGKPSRPKHRTSLGCDLCDFIFAHPFLRIAYAGVLESIPLASLMRILRNALAVLPTPLGSRRAANFENPLACYKMSPQGANDEPGMTEATTPKAQFLCSSSCFATTSVGPRGDLHLETHLHFTSLCSQPKCAERSNF